MCVITAAQRSVENDIAAENYGLVIVVNRLSFVKRAIVDRYRAAVIKRIAGGGKVCRIAAERSIAGEISV